MQLCTSCQRRDGSAPAVWGREAEAPPPTTSVMSEHLYWASPSSFCQGTKTQTVLVIQPRCLSDPWGRWWSSWLSVWVWAVLRSTALRISRCAKGLCSVGAFRFIYPLKHINTWQEEILEHRWADYWAGIKRPPLKLATLFLQSFSLCCLTRGTWERYLHNAKVENKKNLSPLFMKRVAVDLKTHIFNIKYWLWK